MPPIKEDPDDELIDFALFDDISLDGVTSGADPTLWDPIHVDREEKKDNDEGVVDTDLGDDHSQDGVTSGNDGVVGDVKSSERKNKNRN